MQRAPIVHHSTTQRVQLPTVTSVPASSVLPKKQSSSLLQPPLKNLLHTQINNMAPTPAQTSIKHRNIANLEIDNKLFHVFDKAGNKLNIDTLLKNKKTKQIWSRSLDNESGRLTQGSQQRVKGTDTMVFIPKSQIPHDRQVTYSNFVCDYHQLKSEPFIVRMTVGGDKLDYPDETASPAASLIETKLIINSVISDHAKHNSNFCAYRIKSSFLKQSDDKTRISTHSFTIFISRSS